MDSSIVKTFFVLLSCVAAIGGMFYALKKLTKKYSTPADGPELKVISKAALNPKSSVYVVKAGGKTLLLGVTDRSVNILSELDSEEPKAKPVSKEKITAAVNKYYSADNAALSDAAKKNLANGKDLSFTSFLKSAFVKEKS